MPVIATDVGACREMIEGRTDEDRRIGPSGIVTRVAAPKETARRAGPAGARRRGCAGGWAPPAHQRVTAYYQRGDMLARYRALYASLDRRAAVDRSGGEALMAGIGWKLQRMIDRGSLAGTIGAYLTGVAVTSAPWLLTTAVLTSLRMASRHATGDFVIVERFLTVVYAVTVVLSAPVHVVVSRYTADRLYDHHLDRIARAAAARDGADRGRLRADRRRAGAGCCGCRSALALVGAPLTAVIGAQWLMLSVGGGMTSPVVRAARLRRRRAAQPDRRAGRRARGAGRAAPAICTASRPASW